jgi:DNA-binding NarL/FixJ family response regulator
VVGLYFDPPERALVLCVDEKTQVQAREPTAPSVPTQPGQLERRTHDEAAVAVALAGGDGLAAVAAAQGVAVATAPHAQHVCRKTGVRGQAALARLVERLAQVR